MPQSDKKIRLAVVGGGFGATFHFHEHPNCTVTAVTDLYSERRTKLRDHYKCDNVYNSLDDMLAKRRDLDAIAQGLSEIVDENYLRYRAGVNEYVVERLVVAGVSALRPAGGHAVFIDNGVDLGAQSATRTADGVIFTPFFPPAA